MDDIIPFLIVILITVIGSIGQIKKKRAIQQNSAPQPQSDKNDDLFGWLEKLNEPEFDQPAPYNRDFFETPTEKPVETPEVDVVPEPVFEKTVNKYEKYSGFISPEEKQQLTELEGNSAIEKTNAKTDEIKNTQPKSRLYNQKLKEDFDLKKAVIYAEILKRKYQ